MKEIQDIKRTTGLVGKDAEVYLSILNIFQSNTGASDEEMMGYNCDVILYANEHECSLVAAAYIVLIEIEQQKRTLLIEYDGRLLPEINVPNCHASLCERKARWMCDNCCGSICDFHISSASEGHICQTCRIIQWRRENVNNG